MEQTLIPSLPLTMSLLRTRSLMGRAHPLAINARISGDPPTGRMAIVRTIDYHPVGGKSAIGREQTMPTSEKSVLQAKPKMGSKDARLNLRLTAEQKRLIEAAAMLSGQSVTDYVLATVQRQAGQNIQDWE